MKIYTKSGDKGTSSLLDGSRVQKDHYLLETYGLFDELNSLIGQSISYLKTEQSIFIENIEILIQIQKNIFALSSFISCPNKNRKTFNLENISLKDILSIEKEIDSMQQKLPALKNFILPGGTKSASIIHLARSKTRSIERFCIKTFYTEKEKCLDDEIQKIIIYINRLSDFFFVLARYINFKLDVEEIKWP